jgi:hypothetical protein
VKPLDSLDPLVKTITGSSQRHPIFSACSAGLPPGEHVRAMKGEGLEAQRKAYFERLQILDQCGTSWLVEYGNEWK